MPSYCCSKNTLFCSFYYISTQFKKPGMERILTAQLLLIQFFFFFSYSEMVHVVLFRKIINVVISHIYIEGMVLLISLQHLLQVIIPLENSIPDDLFRITHKDHLSLSFYRFPQSQVMHSFLYLGIFFSIVFFFRQVLTR